MPVTRKLLAQVDDDNQVLRMDSSQRFIQNETQDWQFLFGPNSSLSTSTQILKLAAEFDQNNMDRIRIIGYLYNPVTGSVENTATCTFRIYKVSTPNWDDVLLTSVSGTQIPNTYFYKEVLLTSLPTVNFDGGDTIMIEGVATRLTNTYRDRIYINHLGIYDSFYRLKQDVDFLDITKLDE